MRYGQQSKWNRIIPTALLMSIALVALAGCGDGGSGGYAIVALPATTWWPSRRAPIQNGEQRVSIRRRVPGSTEARQCDVTTS
jgi:hypothetical protein